MCNSHDYESFSKREIRSQNYQHLHQFLIQFHPRSFTITVFLLGHCYNCSFKETEENSLKFFERRFHSQKNSIKNTKYKSNKVFRILFYPALHFGVIYDSCMICCRNCLVSRGYTVKVCDLGSGRNAYAADYFRVEGRPPLPIRWMAWEAMLMVSR